MSDKTGLIVVLTTLLVTSVVVFFLGSARGETVRQNTIVTECKANGMYIDRNLIMECRVGVPRIVPKPENML